MSNHPTTPPPRDGAAAAPAETVVAAKSSPVLTHIRSSMFSGLITLVPLFITIYLLWILFDFATKFSKPIAQAIVPFVVRLFRDAPADDPLVAMITSWTWPVLALVITVVVVYILGVLSIFAVGRRILAQFEHFIENLPLVKGIYGTTKQVIGVFRQGSGGQGFQRVVLVQFPRNGTWSVAFVTNTIHDEASNGTLVCCFIPMTPNPTSGFFQMFPENDVRATDWTVDMGIKIILSGGLLAPSTLHAGPVAAASSTAVTTASPSPSTAAVPPAVTG